MVFGPKKKLFSFFVFVINRVHHIFWMWKEMIEIQHKRVWSSCSIHFIISFTDFSSLVPIRKFLTFIHPVGYSVEHLFQYTIVCDLYCFRSCASCEWGRPQVEYVAFVNENQRVTCRRPTAVPNLLWCFSFRGIQPRWMNQKSIFSWLTVSFRLIKCKMVNTII